MLIGIRRSLGWLLSVLALSYFGYYFSQHLDAASSINWNAGDYLLLLLAALTWSLCSIVFGAYPWIWLVRASGEAAPSWPMIRVYSLTQIAKYIPGNIAHQLGRIALAGRLGIDRRHLTWTALVETILTLVAALTQALVGIWVGSQALIEHSEAYFDLGMLGLLCLALLLPVLVWLLVNRWRPRRLARVLGDWQIKLPPLLVFLKCYVFAWFAALAMTAILSLLSDWMLGTEGEIFWTLFASWVIAWAVGFAMPGAPAGLGLREAVLVIGLANVMTPQAAIALTIIQRLITVLADGFVFLLGLAIPDQRSGKKLNPAGGSQ